MYPLLWPWFYQSSDFSAKQLKGVFPVEEIFMFTRIFSLPLNLKEMLGRDFVTREVGGWPLGKRNADKKALSFSGEEIKGIQELCFRLRLTESAATDDSDCRFIPREISVSCLSFMLMRLKLVIKLRPPPHPHPSGTSQAPETLNLASCSHCIMEARCVPPFCS